MSHLGKEERQATCQACELAKYEPPDTDGFQPPALNHTCREKGPKTKKEILKTLEKAAYELYHSSSAKMPGGNYHAKNEVNALIWRLGHANEKKEEYSWGW